MPRSIVGKVVRRAPTGDSQALLADASPAGNRAGTAVAVIGSGASMPEAAEKAARAPTKVANTSIEPAKTTRKRRNPDEDVQPRSQRQRRRTSAGGSPGHGADRPGRAGPGRSPRRGSIAAYLHGERLAGQRLPLSRYQPDQSPPGHSGWVRLRAFERLLRRQLELKHQLARGRRLVGLGAGGNGLLRWLQEHLQRRRRRVQL
ncbi:hypothetical protein D3C81_1410590 [compost metagenome]